jgi:signal transduction histidine kinase
MELPVDAAVTADRLPEAVEATAYFIVAEALANAARHSRATRVHVAAIVDHNDLRIESARAGTLVAATLPLA